MTLEIKPCLPSDYVGALSMLYRRAPEVMRPKLVAEALEAVEREEINLSGLWIAWRKGRIAGVLLSQGLAGRAAAVWAPEVSTGWGRSAVARALVRSALEALRVAGYRVAQGLVDSGSPPRAGQDLSGGGMPRVTHLSYMTRETAPALEVAPGVPRFDWRSYGPQAESDFREVLRESYVGSLDMPELEGIRSLDDVLASHCAAGRFDADHWLVGRLSDESRAAAVLLLASHPDRDAWEIAYLGLTPKARGRGLGRSSLAQAIAMARDNAPRIELAVDVRNTPAERLYRAAGFTAYDRRSVHVSVFS
jgi:mycothiol synthase